MIRPRGTAHATLILSPARGLHLAHSQGKPRRGARQLTFWAGSQTANQHEVTTAETMRAQRWRPLSPREAIDILGGFADRKPARNVNCDAESQLLTFTRCRATTNTNTNTSTSTNTKTTTTNTTNTKRRGGIATPPALQATSDNGSPGLQRTTFAKSPAP